MGPSSTSVTVTVYLMVSPNSKKPPLSGSCRSTTGVVLPATMSMLVVPVLPLAAVTVSFAV